MGVEEEFPALGSECSVDSVWGEDVEEDGEAGGGGLG